MTLFGDEVFGEVIKFRCGHMTMKAEKGVMSQESRNTPRADDKCQEL